MDLALWISRGETWRDSCSSVTFVGKLSQIERKSVPSVSPSEWPVAHPQSGVGTSGHGCPGGEGIRHPRGIGTSQWLINAIRADPSGRAL